MAEAALYAPVVGVLRNVRAILLELDTFFFFFVKKYIRGLLDDFICYYCYHHHY